MQRFTQKMIKKVDQRNQRIVQQEDQHQQRLSSMQQCKSIPIDSPGKPDMKSVDFCGKHRQFVPDPFHRSMFPKPADGVLKKTKCYRRDEINKRSEVLKFNKDDA